MDEETSSIDKSVREVVKAHVEEVVTEMVDTKVQETVVEMKDELTKEKLVELLTGDAIREIINETDLEGAISSGDLGDEFATESYVDNAVEDHEHDSYDVWNSIDSYVYEAIEEKISEHVEETSHGGGGGSGPITKSQLQSLLTILGISSHFDGNKLSSMSTADSGFGAWPMATSQGIAARLVKLEQKTAGIGTSISPVSGAADPRVDQLMAWAQHVDNILKAAAESTVLNQEVPA